VPAGAGSVATQPGADDAMEAETSPEPSTTREGSEGEGERLRPAPRRYGWAALLQRVFAADALRCPRCGATLRLLAAIEDPAIARRILECMRLPARAPPLAPAGAVGPPETQWPDGSDAPEDFDQRPPDERR